MKNDNTKNNLLGIKYSKNNDYEKALSFFNKDLRIKNKKINHIANYNIGLIYQKLNKHKKAIFYFKSAIEISKIEFEYYLQLGLSYYEINNYLDALKYYKKSLKLQNNYLAWNNVGVIYFKKNKFINAKCCFLKSIENNNEYKDTWFNLKDTYDELGLSKERDQAYKKYLSL